MKVNVNMSQPDEITTEEDLLDAVGSVSVLRVLLGLFARERFCVLAGHFMSMNSTSTKYNNIPPHVSATSSLHALSDLCVRLISPASLFSWKELLFFFFAWGCS